MKKLVNTILRIITMDVILVSVLFVAAFFLFGYVAHEIVGEDDNAFDEKIFSFFNLHSPPLFISIMHVLTFFGTMTFILPAYILLIGFLLFKHRRTEAVNIAIIAITSTALMFGLKEFYKRQRPELPLFKAANNFSFPSGHALCSFILCSVFIYIIWRSQISKKWKWIFAVLLVLFSIAIGISRIVLRYHYASDVLAGLYLGFVWASMALWLERKLIPRKLERQLDV